MTVALFASSFYPHLGGVEEHVRQVAHAFRRRNISPVVLTNRWPRSLPRSEQYEDIPVHRIAMRVPDGSAKARINFRLTHWWIYQRMIALLRRYDVRILHVHCVSANGFYARLAQRTLRLPLVVSTHGERTMDATGLFDRSPFMNRVLRELLDSADHVTACSAHTLHDTETYRGRAFGTKGSVVYNGIQPADFDSRPSAPHPRPYVLGIGRLVPQKGFDILIRAFAQAGAVGHDLLLAGEGPEAAPLKALAAELGVADRVRFFGRADRPAAIALFKNCEFFVLPSRIEPMGIVNLEAMAAGKAVIASDVGGVPEVVLNGSTGLLVPPGNPALLAAGMNRLATDATLRRKLASTGRARAEEFTWDAAADRYIEIYRSLAPNQAQPSARPPMLAPLGR